MPITVAAATTTSRFERMRASLVLTGVAVLLALGLSFGCANRKQAPGRASASAAAPLPDLPEPAGLVAELAIAHPGAAYRALRELGSPLSSLLPAGFPVLAASALGLPPLCADSFDPEIPTVGALVQIPDADPGWVLAVHALSGPELVAKLCTGDHAPFRQVAGDTTGLTLMQPNARSVASPSASSFALAVLGNYLLVASVAPLLSSVGPYVVRTLARRSPPPAAISLRVSQHALANALVPMLRGWWAGYRTNLIRQDQSERSAHAGRAPDFADPAQVILGADAGVESVLGLIEGAAGLEFDLEPLPDRLEVTVSLTPDAAANPNLLASLGSGNAQALLTLPRYTQFAFGISRSDAERVEAAKAAGDDWVRLLGSRLSEPDAQKLRSVLSDWELGRGTTTSYGFLGGKDSGAFLISDVADALRLKHAGHGLLGLMSLPSVRAPLSEFLGQPQVTESVAPPSDWAKDVQRAKISFGPSPKQPKPALSPFDAAWFVADKTGFAAAGRDSLAVLQAAVHAARAEQPALAANAGFGDAVARMGNQAALFAYADVAAFGAPKSDEPASSPAPVFLSVGKREANARLRLEVSHSAVNWALHGAFGR